MGEEEGAGAGVVELTPIVALYAADVSRKLSLNIGEKMGQTGEGF